MGKTPPKWRRGHRRRYSEEQEESYPITAFT